MRTKPFILIFFIITLCTSLFAAEKKQAIVKGDSVSHNDFSSVVAVKSSSSFCSGVLAQNNLVITAKHCITNDDDISVIYGADKMSQVTSDNIFKGINVKNHPDLDVSIILTNYAIGECSPINPRSVHIGDVVVIAGYGRSDYEDENSSGTLRAGQTKVYNVTANGISTEENYASICFGDSGGPLYKEGYISGINSASRECNNGRYVSSSAFVTWVQQYYIQMLFEENLLFNEDIDLTSGYCKYSNAEYFYPPEGCSCYIGKNETNILIPLMFFLTIVLIRKKY